MNKRARVIELIYGSDLMGTRFLLGIAELLWAVTLLWPGETFGRPTYHGMQLFATEEVWGFIFLFSSFWQFQILKSRKFHCPAAVVFAGWNSLLWIFVVVSMYMSVYPPPAAISGELALAIGAAWIFVRTGAPVPRTDRREHVGSHLAH